MRLMIFTALTFILSETVHAGSQIKFFPVNFCWDGDGVPISGELESKCCKRVDPITGLVDNPDPACKGGFTAVKYESLGNIANAIQISNATLQAAQELTGVEYDASIVPSSETLNSGANLMGSGDRPYAAAMNSGAKPGVSMGSYETNAKKDVNETESGAATGGSGGAAGAGSGGLGYGLGGSSSAGKSGAGSGGELLASKESTSGYTSGEGGARAGSGFGSGGSGSAGVGESGAASDLKFQEGSESNASSSLADEDGVGSADDPSDYFKRIDPSASIFKIVSARYGRKKSLWVPGGPVQPQIVPVIKR